MDSSWASDSKDRSPDSMPFWNNGLAEGFIASIFQKSMRMNSLFLESVCKISRKRGEIPKATPRMIMIFGIINGDDLCITIDPPFFIPRLLQRVFCLEDKRRQRRTMPDRG